MRRIAIQDANILIDLVNIGLFSHCLALDYEFSTTQLIFEVELKEDQMAAIQVHIDSEKFRVINISAQELLEIQIASQEDTRLSEQDWSAIYYCERDGAILLSGDKHMKKMSAKCGIEVHGILWLFDQLVTTAVISKNDGCSFLKTLMKANRWLPVTECKKRIDQWCGEL